MNPLLLLVASVGQPPPVAIERPPVVYLERSTPTLREAPAPVVVPYPIYIQPTVTVLPATYAQQTQQYQPQYRPQYQPQYTMPCPPPLTYAPQYTRQIAAPAVAVASPFAQAVYTPATLVPGAGISLQQERGRGWLRPPTRTELTITGAQSAELRGGTSGCASGRCQILAR